MYLYSARVGRSERLKEEGANTNLSPEQRACAEEETPHPLFEREGGSGKPGAGQLHNDDL